MYCKNCGTAIKEGATDTSNNSKNNRQSVNTLSDEMIKNYISFKNT